MLAPRVTFLGGVAVVMARKHLARALMAALSAALKKASGDDRAFILRWIDAADDPAFERLVADLIEQGEIGDDPHVVCGTVISLARGEWHTATDLKHGVDSTSWRAQGEITELQQLAQKADDLANFCRGSGKRDLASLMSPQVGLGPIIKQNGMMPLHRLADLHALEAHVFRQFAAQEAERDQVRRSRYRISRQRYIRDRIAFMNRMATCFHELGGKPHYDAIAVITNIAFPDADVTVENVRAACRPTTRQGRRRKTGAQKQEKRA
jgi:hypothetical protein